MKNKDKILILDFGSQYTQLIARRVREIGVFSVVKPSSLSVDKIIEMNPSGIILSGGPETVTISSSQKVDKSLLFMEQNPCPNLVRACSKIFVRMVVRRRLFESLLDVLVRRLFAVEIDCSEIVRSLV